MKTLNLLLFAAVLNGCASKVMQSNIADASSTNNGADAAAENLDQGCSEPDPQSFDNAPAPAPSSWYLGTIEICRPGAPVIKMGGMIQRKLFADQGIIVERVAYYNLATLKAQPEHIAVINANAGSFVDADGGFTGTLIFTGDAWKWTKWVETIKFPNATGMLSIDRVTTDGGLIAMKYMFAAGIAPSLDNANTMVIKESYKPATEAEYNQIAHPGQ